MHYILCNVFLEYYTLYIICIIFYTYAIYLLNLYAFIRLHGQKSTSWLPGSALKAVVGGWGGGQTDSFVPPNLSWGWVGLWQLSLANTGLDYLRQMEDNIN